MVKNAGKSVILHDAAIADAILTSANLSVTTTDEQATLAKAEFLSHMTHEIRTQLSAILGFAQLLESGSPSPTDSQQRSIDRILQAGWNLEKFIDETIARIESGKLNYEYHDDR